MALAILIMGGVWKSATAQGGALNWTQISTADGDLAAPSKSKQQTASLVLDVDGDGINDFVIAARRDPGPSLVWYRRTASGWTRHVIDDEVLDIEAGGDYHDIDGDGDLDVVMGGDSRSNKVWWWENPYPDFDASDSWTRREIKSSGATKHHDAIFGDFDGDGRIELVFWNQGAQALFLAEIPENPRTSGTWALTPVYSWSDVEHEGLAAADVDGDGLLDIVGGGRWFKYAGNSSFTPEIIDAAQSFTRVVAGQFIRGGRPEIVFVKGDTTGPLMFYAWSDGEWSGQDLLGKDITLGHSLERGDIDRDGNLDLFLGEMGINGNDNAKTWILFGDGRGNFKVKVLFSGYGQHESRLADLDGDGDLDILGKPYTFGSPGISIWLNDAGRISLDRWQRHPIDDERPHRAVFVTPADLNGDGLFDVLAGAWWYANPGAIAKPWQRREIGASLDQLAAVYDFDGDGDQDILGTVRNGRPHEGNEFVWARNDGAGQFSVMKNIERGDGDFLQGVAVGPLAADGELAVALSWHQAGKGVQLLTVPDDPSTDVWTWSQIAAVSQDEALSSDDIDGDGDADLSLGTLWLRNDNGQWSVQTLHSTDDAPDRNVLRDVNGDGRLDAVIGYEKFKGAGTLVWYEQGAAADALWEPHPIADLVGPMSIDVADLDGDGDLDVVAGEHITGKPESAGLFVFENLDGVGTAWKPVTVWTGDEHHDGAQLADFDNDGDLDIVSIGWTHDRVVIYENLGRTEHRIFLPIVTAE